MPTIFWLILLGLLVLVIALLVLEGHIRTEAFQNAPSPSSYSFPAGLALINLDRRPDRLDSFKTTWDASRASKLMEFKRFSAVDAKTFNIEDYITPESYADILADRRRMSKNKVSGKDIGVGLTKGGVGCYRSHIEVLKFIASQDKPWIVCEDDAKIPANFAEQIKEFLPKVPFSPHGMILFHAFCSSSAEHAKALHCDPVGNGVLQTDQFWSLACFYILPETAKKILEHAGTPPYDMEIDAKISELAQMRIIQIYVGHIVTTGWSDTDIQNKSKYYKPDT